MAEGQGGPGIHSPSQGVIQPGHGGLHPDRLQRRARGHRGLLMQGHERGGASNVHRQHRRRATRCGSDDYREDGLSEEGESDCGGGDGDEGGRELPDLQPDPPAHDGSLGGRESPLHL